MWRLSTFLAPGRRSPTSGGATARQPPRLARSLADFARALAHGPAVDEFADSDARRSRLSREYNGKLDAQSARYERAVAALDRYRGAAEARFGDLASLDELTAGLQALEDELSDWIESRIG